MTQSQQLAQRAEEAAAAEKKKQSLGQAYYLGIAKKIRVVMIALIIVLAGFLAFMFSRYRSEITVENLRYFFRYIDTRQAEKSATTDTIVYDDIEAIVQTDVFKNGLVLVGHDQVKIYDLTGEAILNLNKVNAQPCLLCGDKYMMIYNIGGTTFQVYNSLACVYEEAYDFGISVAAMGDTGKFLVATRSIEYRSVVNVYDKDFQQIYRWYTPDKLIMAADFAKGDKEFLISALGNRDDGSFYSEILLCQTDKEEKKLDFIIPDEVIYRVSCANDGGLILVGGKAIYYYDKSGNERAQVSYDGYTPTTVVMENDLVCSVINKNLVGSNYELTVTNGSGKVLYQNPIIGEITKVLLQNDALYVLLDRSVVRINLETGTLITKSVPANATTLLSLEDGTLLLCYAEKTYVIDVQSFFFGDKEIE